MWHITVGLEPWGCFFFFDLFITSWWVAQELCFLAYSAPQA